jgi:hypothetical protein
MIRQIQTFAKWYALFIGGMLIMTVPVTMAYYTQGDGVLMKALVFVLAIPFFYSAWRLWGRPGISHEA